MKCHRHRFFHCENLLFHSVDAIQPLTGNLLLCLQHGLQLLLEFFESTILLGSFGFQLVVFFLDDSELFFEGGGLLCVLLAVELDALLKLLIPLLSFLAKLQDRFEELLN